MIRIILLIACTSLLLAACVRQPEFKADGYAFIRSSYPIIKLGDEVIEPAYKLDIEAGDITVMIVYNTYKHDYYCIFSWNAVENSVYEVTNQVNRYPLTLYRWVRTNSLWASRLDPLSPLDCVREQRS